jgi:hypothetical protein
MRYILRCLQALCLAILGFLGGLARRLAGAGPSVPLAPPEPTSAAPRPTEQAPSSKSTLSALELASAARRIAHRLLGDRDATELLASIPPPLAHQLRTMSDFDLRELLRQDLDGLARRIEGGRLSSPRAARRVSDERAIHGGVAPASSWDIAPRTPRMANASPFGL